MKGVAGRESCAGMRGQVERPGVKDSLTAPMETCGVVYIKEGWAVQCDNFKDSSRQVVDIERDISMCFFHFYYFYTTFQACKS